MGERRWQQENRHKEESAKNSLFFMIKICLILLHIIFYILIVKWPLMPIDNHEYWFGVLLYGALLGFLMKAKGGYYFGTVRVGELAYTQAIVLFYTSVLTCVGEVIIGNPIGIGRAIAVMALNWVVSVCVALAGDDLYFKITPTLKTIIVKADGAIHDPFEELTKYPKEFNVIAEYTLSDLSERLWLLNEVEAVFLCGIPSNKRNDILKYCIQHDVQVFIRPKISDLLISGAEKMNIMNTPVYRCQRAKESPSYAMIKRAMDIALSSAALIVATPLMACIALAIHLYDHGPILFKQVRLTKDGREFEILKFRSMIQNAEEDGIARLAEKNDGRITPVGRIIRSLRLDELPQMFNILKGEMSIVGPRPERPEIASLYLDEFALRLQVKAGLTGYAQVYGKYNTEPYDKLQMDLMYIANRSMYEDIRLILLTISTLFKTDSTEGVDAEQVTANSKSMRKTA